MLILLYFSKGSSSERRLLGLMFLLLSILQFLVLLKFSDGASYVKLLTKLNIIRPLEVCGNSWDQLSELPTMQVFN